jgi:8-oxo-dGTP pyrophosphatase MutT (NUDIX family)
MRIIYDYIGRLIHFFSYPLILIGVSGSSRTRVLVIQDRQLLLVRDWIGNGRWSFTGGGMHPNEDPIDGAIREVSEEVGIVLNKTDLKFIETIDYVKKGVRSTRYIYLARLETKPAIQLQRYEIFDAKWFDETSLANIKLADDVKLIISKHNNLLKT